MKSRLGDHVASETHVKQALQIYGACGFDRPERHGDLLSYLAVMVDRQKRRKEAEVYYQEALLMYKQHNVEGDNVTITAKNLRLNQKRQVRETHNPSTRIQRRETVRALWCVTTNTSTHPSIYFLPLCISVVFLRRKRNRLHRQRRTRAVLVDRTSQSLPPRHFDHLVLSISLFH